jgi:hypothetical protein
VIGNRRLKFFAQKETINIAVSGDRDNEEESGEQKENRPQEKLPGRAGMQDGDSILRKRIRVAVRQ